MITDHSEIDKQYTENLREKFNSPEMRGNMSEEELLGLLLSYTDCRRNLSHIMDLICERFPCVEDIYRCSYEELMQIDKMTPHGAYAILLVSKIFPGKCERLKAFKKNSDYEELFYSLFTDSKEEEIWAAIFNSKDELVTAKKIANGTFGHSDMSMGDLIELTVSVNSHKIVLAHSHPYTNISEVSEEDREAINYMGRVLDRFSICLLGHVVVCESASKFYPWTAEDCL